MSRIQTYDLGIYFGAPIMLEAEDGDVIEVAELKMWINKELERIATEIKDEQENGDDWIDGENLAGQNKMLTILLAALKKEDK